MNKERKVDERGRELHTVTCVGCGNETQVPFTPDGSKLVYCQECYRKHRSKRY